MSPLATRDANRMATNRPTDGKRKHVEHVDLTVDSDTEKHAQTAKVQKRAADINVRRGVRTQQQQATSGAAASAYVTPPSSRDPPSSINAPTGSFADNHPVQAGHSSSQDDGDEVNEIIFSTQEAADNDQLQNYGDLHTKVVGVRYYRGYANPGEYILMRREPHNQYDSNAIRIDNVAGAQIGHIPRNMAAKLARYMDNGWLYMEGRLAGEIGHFDCPLEVRMFGPDFNSVAGQQLKAKMQADNLPLNVFREAERREKEAQKAREQAEKRRQQEEKKRLTEARRAAAAKGQYGRTQLLDDCNPQYANYHDSMGSSEVPNMGELLEASQRFNPREIGQTAEKYGLQEQALSQMALAEKPESIATEMLPYQRQALKWLLDQENPQLPPHGSKEAVQLWSRKSGSSNLFTNLGTNHTTDQTPKLASGGILADDMGLGKTLEMISLIVADAEKNGRGTSLVVAPLSVMSNWSGQIAHHVRKDKPLNVYTYHGTGRVQMKAEDFARYDVVITTYQTLASDYMPRGKGSKQPERKLRSSGLYSVVWRRIILDEGHTVRNPQSKGAAAVTALIARSRWVLTGTPLVNSLKDLYCLLRFVGISGGLEKLEIFNGVLVRPLKAGSESAIFLLQAIMTAFTLRRRKEMAFIDLKLPRLDEYVHRVEFTPKERERYEALVAEAQGLLKNVERRSKRPGETAQQAYQHLLEILLRMRQCCNHWQLCGERVTNLLAQLEEHKTVALTPENKKALQDMLQVHIESQEDCAICLGSLHNPVITTCTHFFGEECISKVIESQHKCPMCRAELKDNTCLVHPANECGDEAADNELDLTASSSKLESLMQILAATRASGQGEKTVVFSQWTKFLDIVQARLDREGFKYCRLDGTMPASKRDEALQSLEKDEDCTIMLASLGVCAVGLNLTAANSIVLSDTWWAPAIEDQAVDRVHRLGQKRETRVVRLVVDGSIEERTIEIQQEKRKLMMLAFSEQNSKRDAAKAGRLADIQKLLAPTPAGETKET